MKNLTLAILLLFASSLFAQENPEVKDNEIHLLKAIDRLPEYPGGLGNLYTYISENFNPVGYGHIIATFVIEKDGSVTDIRIVKSMNEESDNRLIRLLKDSPKWQPGSIKGKPVRVRYSLPVKVKFPSAESIPVNRQ